MSPNFFPSFFVTSVLDHVTDFDFNFHRSKNLVKMKWVKTEGKPKTYEIFRVMDFVFNFHRSENLVKFRGAKGSSLEFGQLRIVQKYTYAFFIH